MLPSGLKHYGARACSAILSGRLAGQFFENAIKLRQRLESGRERDLAYAQVEIVQERARLFKPGAGNVVDKINPGHLLELFTQMIRANIDRPCHLRQRKLFIRMRMDKIPSFPNFDRLRSIPLSRTNGLQLR